MKILFDELPQTTIEEAEILKKLYGSITVENISVFTYSGPKLIIKCVESNPNMFSKEESSFILELANSRDLNNLIIAISIINAK